MNGGTTTEINFPPTIYRRRLAGVYPFEEENSDNGDTSQQSSVAITDQTGVERLDKDAPSSQPSTRFYDRDWRPLIDREEIRSPDGKR